MTPLTADDYRKAVRVSDHPWQTPPPRPRTVTLTAAEAVALTEEIDSLRDKVRFWRYVYLTMCVQFAVVTIAAIWGWAR